MEIGAVSEHVDNPLSQQTTVNSYLAAKLSNGKIVLLTQNNRAILGEVIYVPTPQGAPVPDSDFNANHSTEIDAVYYNTFFDDTRPVSEITIMRPETVSGTMEVSLNVEQQYQELYINGIRSLFSFENPDYQEIAPSNIYNL